MSAAWIARPRLSRGTVLVTVLLMVAVAAIIATDIAYRQMTPQAMAQLAAERVLPHAARPEDIAAVVAFLASDDAAVITGQTLVADGGALAHRPLHAMRAWERQQQ